MKMKMGGSQRTVIPVSLPYAPSRTVYLELTPELNNSLRPYLEKDTELHNLTCADHCPRPLMIIDPKLAQAVQKYKKVEGLDVKLNFFVSFDGSKPRAPTPAEWDEIKLASSLSL